MEELRSSPPPPTSVTTAATGRRREESAISSVKKGCLCFTTSVQESFYHVKALIVGQAKKLTARNEKEAAEADLQAAKMQVEATDYDSVESTSVVGLFQKNGISTFVELSSGNVHIE